MQKLKLLAALLVAGLGLAACGGGGGFTSEDAESIRIQISDVQARLDQVEERMEQISDNGDPDSEELLGEAQEELSEARNTLAQVDLQLAPAPEPAQDEFSDDLGNDPGTPTMESPDGFNEVPSF